MDLCTPGSLILAVEGGEWSTSHLGISTASQGTPVTHTLGS